MPTRPSTKILDRAASIAGAAEIIHVALPPLEEMVNYATTVYETCAAAADPDADEHVAVLSLYLHMIEMTDGVEVLISQSCPIPALPLVRSSFEALLSTEYILRDDYERRSLAWLAAYYHKRLDVYETLDRTTEKGRAFSRAVQADKRARHTKLPRVSDVRKAMRDLESVLAKEHFKPIQLEIARYEDRGKPWRWHQLFGGPANLRELAHHVERSAQYDVLYREWTTVSHAHDVSRLVRQTRGKPTAALRDGGMIVEVVLNAASWMLEATRLLLLKFRPEADMAPWYNSEVGEAFMRLADDLR